MQPEPLGSRYVLEELLGTGGMGRVYRAGIAADGGAVAVKVLRDDLAADPKLVHRFLVEGRALRSVDHPNVVRIHDLVAGGGRLAIVMDLVTGGDLRHAVPLPCDEANAARIGAGIARGLDAVHAAGIVHRDLKPENVLVEPGEGDRHGLARVRLADFGVSILDCATTTLQHGLIGTVGYIAPEVAHGRPATPASDLYALGVILYELCAGHGPFRAEHPLALIRAHAQDPVPRPEGLTEPLWQLVAQLLAKEPFERPAARDVVARLDALCAELPTAPGCDRSVPPEWFALPARVADADDAIAGGPAPATLASAPTTMPVGPSAPPAPPVAPAPVAPGLGGRRPALRTVLVTVAAVTVVAVGATLATTMGGSAKTDRAVPIAKAGPLSPGPATDTDARPSSTPIGPTSPTPTSTLPATVGAGPGQSPAPLAAAPMQGAPGQAVPGQAAQGPTAPAVQVTVTRTEPVPGSMAPPVPSATAAPAVTTVGAAPPAPATVPLYRHYNATTGDHFYSISPTEMGSQYGYTPEGVEVKVFANAVDGSVPVYRYWNKTLGDHAYTTSYTELGSGKNGYVFERIGWYAYATERAGTVAVYRYWNKALGDHLYTTDRAGMGTGKNGYVLEGLAWYGL